MVIQMTINDRIKYFREKAGMSQQELAEKVGFKTASAVNKIELGLRNLNLDKINAFALALNIPPALLLGWEPDELDKKVLEMYPDWFPYEGNYLPTNPKIKSPKVINNTVTFPVIGELAAGYEHIAVEDWSGETIEIPESYLKGRKREDFLVLSVKGDSMYPHYHDGDKVLILKQDCINESGDIAAVIYDGEYATLKKVEYKKDVVRLLPLNPEYMPKEISGADLEQFKIIGIPRLLVRDIED